MRPQPLIAVTDVEASSHWYQRLLGCKSDHGGKEYERLTFNGKLIMQLHSFSIGHHHGPIGDSVSNHTAMACCFGLRLMISIWL